jgi:hypothetical protein
VEFWTGLTMDELAAWIADISAAAREDENK